MLRFFLCLLLCFMPFSQASAEDTTTIVVFGDSLVAGYGLPPEDSFSSQLDKKLRDDKYNVQVINEGVSGDTTAGGVSRIDSIIEKKPQAVIIILGGNDLLRGLPPEDTKSNLNTIMERFHQAGIKMLVAGQRAPLTLGLKYAGDFNGIFCDLAKHYDAQCYAFFLEGVFGHADLMQDDGIHPNKQGVEAVVDKIYPKVTKMLKK